MRHNGQIAVIGAGLMGHGIALTFARAGMKVFITDPHAATLESTPERVAESMRHMGADEGEIAKTIEKIMLCDTLAAAVGKAAYVFEAAPEKLELKRAIFAEIEDHAPAAAILASNTSVI